MNFTPLSVEKLGIKKLENYWILMYNWNSGRYFQFEDKYYPVCKTMCPDVQSGQSAAVAQMIHDEESII